MHKSAEEKMRRHIEKNIVFFDNPTVLEFGSRIVGGQSASHRPFFDSYKCEYIGADIVEGKNVDVVMDAPYSLPMENESVDIIVTGQVIEHIPYVWASFMELARILKPGGLIFCSAPSRGHIHSPPYDCWRYLPDSYKSLAVFCGLHLLELEFDDAPKRANSKHYDYGEIPDGQYWGDVLGVFQKTQTYDEKKISKVRKVITEWANTVADVHTLNDKYAPNPEFAKKLCVKHKAFDVYFPRAPEIITDRIITSLNKGYYEAKEARALLKYMKKGARVLELGAGIGFMACIANQKQPEAHVVVEADPRVIPVMKATHEINGLKNVLIQNCAVTSDPKQLKEGFIEFQFGKEFWGSTIKEKAASGKYIKVPTQSFAAFVANFQPDTLIIDIEGAEVDLFGAVDLSGIDLIVLETHPYLTGPGSVELLIRQLAEEGLKIAEKGDDNDLIVFARNT